MRVCPIHIVFPCIFNHDLILEKYLARWCFLGIQFPRTHLEKHWFSITPISFWLLTHAAFTGHHIALKDPSVFTILTNH